MNQEEKPISELITSIDSTIDQSEESIPKEKKSYTFLIIVTILLVLIGIVGVYYVYNEYFAEKEEDANEYVFEEEPVTEEVRVELGDDMYLLVKLENSECDDTGFQKIEQEEGYTVWEDNQNKYCSSSFILSYFKTLEDMTMYFANTDEVPTLEKVTFEDIEYEYISKEDENEEFSSGIAYVWNPTIDVKEYKAFRLLSYSNLDTSIEIEEGSSITTYCGFDLTELEGDIGGYLVFRGSGSVGSNTNYCELLNKGVFEIEVSL